MVVFCEAIATFNYIDLHHLGEFVSSIRPATGDSEAAVRLYNLCSAFYEVAQVYFAESTASIIGSSSNVSSNPPLTPQISQGFSEGNRSAVSGSGGVQPPLQNFPLASENSFLGQALENDAYMTWPAEDWFLPDQYMMGILDPGFGTN